jgi:hypothetical protein
LEEPVSPVARKDNRSKPQRYDTWADAVILRRKFPGFALAFTSAWRFKTPLYTFVA